jgi:hypothetical protein
MERASFGRSSSPMGLLVFGLDKLNTSYLSYYDVANSERAFIAKVQIR